MLPVSNSPITASFKRLTLKRGAESPHPSEQLAKIRKTEQQQNTLVESPRGAFHFVEDGKAAQRVIEACRQQDDRQLYVIRCPDDIDFHGLRQRIHYPSPGKKQEQSGLLFTAQPITLVIDCTAMNPVRIASLNDLLEDQPKLDGKPIKPNIHRVLLASRSQAKDPNGPDADFFRRAFRFAQPETKAAIHANDPVPMKTEIQDETEWLLHQVPTVAKPSGNSVMIDCICRDAYGALFGELKLNKQGKVEFRPGLITAQTSGTPLCLINPPESGDPFWHHLADIMRQGYFVANGEMIPLPQYLELQQYRTPTAEVTAFKQAITETKLLPDVQTGFINGYNIESLLADNVVKDGTVQQTDTLATFMASNHQLVVTNGLSDRQWLMLKQRYEAVDSPCPLFSGIIYENILYEKNVRLRCYDPDTQLPPTGSADYHYILTSGAEWETLWYRTRLRISGSILATLHKSELLQKLEQGVKVVFIGLENAPELAGHLETLLAPNPYLWVAGQKILLPHADIDVIWPFSRPPSGGLWQLRFRQVALSASRLNHNQLERYGSDYTRKSLDDLMQKLTGLPISVNKSYPRLPIQPLPQFFRLLRSRLRQEMAIDHSEQCRSYHWRKALNKLLAHPVREDNRIYSYLKTLIAHFFPDNPVPSDTAVDCSGLRAVLGQTPLKNPETIEARFWELARFMVPVITQHLPDKIDTPPCSDALATMTAVLAKVLPESQIALPGGYPLVSVQPYDGNQRRLLHDALLAAGDRLLQKNQPVHHQVLELEQALKVLELEQELQLVELEQKLRALELKHKNKSISAGQMKKRVSGILGRWLPQKLLQGDFNDLAGDWLEGGAVSIYRHQKRLRQIKSIIKDQKIVEFNGPTGSGKSWLAQAMAAELNGGTPPLTLSLGADVQWEDLYGNDELVTDLDSAGKEQQYTRFVPGPLLAWAENPNPPLLIIDEANLVPAGLLSPLAGLRENPPRLCLHGKIILLSQRHRVILTGNPESYAGRKLDPELQKQIVRLYYRPIPKPLLVRSIIRPQLSGNVPDTLLQATTTILLALYENYQNLLPEHEVTPRDLNDVLARMRQIIRYADTPPKTGNQARSLVIEAFRQSLGALVSPHEKVNWAAMNNDYHSMGKTDDSMLLGQKQAFDDFFNRLRIDNQRCSPPLVLDTPDIKEYIRACWEFLTLEAGRQGLLVEGPAGWGKDVLLQRTLQTWSKLNGNKPYRHINADPARPDDLRKAVADAETKTYKILIISELNLFHTAHVEAVLNAPLTTGEPNGLKLITTVNPKNYSGRNSLSRALSNRFTQVKLAGDVTEDYHARMTVMGIEAGLSRWLTECFSMVNRTCTENNLRLRLTLPELLDAATALQTIGVPERQKQLEQRWHFYLDISGLQALPQQNFDSVKGSNEGGATCTTTVSSTQAIKPRGAVPKTINRPFSRTLRRSKSDEKASSRGVGNIFTFDLNSASTTRVAFGNILRHSHCNIQWCFPREPYDYTQYRMGFLETIFDEKGRWLNRPIRWQDGFCTPLGDGSEFMGRQIFARNEIPGQITLDLTTAWKPLPSLTDIDELRGLKIRPDTIPIELARSDLTGQLLIRATACSVKTVTIDFIIVPNKDYFTSIKTEQVVESHSGLCNPTLRKILDNGIFSKPACEHTTYHELKAINAINNIPKRLQALCTWLDSFSGNKNIAGSDGQLLIAMLKEKQGVCRHKATLFQLLCNYWGIPVRQVTNASHQFAELSIDGGQHWRSFQLGGGGQSNLRYSPEISSPFLPGLSSSASTNASPFPRGFRQSPGISESREVIPRQSPAEPEFKWSAYPGSGLLKAFTKPKTTLFSSGLSSSASVHDSPFPRGFRQSPVSGENREVIAKPSFTMPNPKWIDSRIGLPPEVFSKRNTTAPHTALPVCDLDHFHTYNELQLNPIKRILERQKIRDTGKMIYTQELRREIKNYVKRHFAHSSEKSRTNLENSTPPFLSINFGPRKKKINLKFWLFDIAIDEVHQFVKQTIPEYYRSPTTYKDSRVAAIMLSLGMYFIDTELTPHKNDTQSIKAIINKWSEILETYYKFFNAHMYLTFQHNVFFKILNFYILYNSDKNGFARSLKSKLFSAENIIKTFFHETTQDQKKLLKRVTKPIRLDKEVLADTTEPEKKWGWSYGCLNINRLIQNKAPFSTRAKKKGTDSKAPPVIVSGHFLANFIRSQLGLKQTELLPAGVSVYDGLKNYHILYVTNCRSCPHVFCHPYKYPAWHDQYFCVKESPPGKNFIFHYPFGLDDMPLEKADLELIKMSINEPDAIVLG